MRSPSELTAPQPSYTVLIVNSSSQDRELYRRSLLADSSCCYTVLESDSATAAIAVYQRQAIDGLLLDYALPDSTGLEFVQQLQRLNLSLPPIVILASEPDTALAVRAIKLGVEDFLLKQTLTPAQLQLSMRSAIENTRLRLELQHQEERFRVSIENMLDCVGIYTAIRDAEGQIIDFRIDYLNAAALAASCMTQADLGRLLCEALPAHWQTGLFADYCRVVETGNPLVKAEFVYTDRFGADRLTRVFDIHASKLNDGFVASWRDVTARKQAELERLRVEEERQQAEMQLHESLRFIQQVSDAAPGFLYVYDLLAQRNVYVNQRITEILGYETDQIAAMGDQVLVQLVHPDDLAIAPQQIAKFQASQPDKIIEWEYRIRHASGEWLWFLAREVVYRWTPEGRPHQILGIAQEITDRKQIEAALRESEQRFRGIFNTTYQFIGLLSPAGIVLEANQTALDFGGLSREEVIGRPFWELRWWTISPQTQQQLQDAIARTAQGEFVRYEVEVLGAASTTTIDFSLKPIRNAAGQVVLLIPEGRDIGERKQVEAALEQQARTLCQQFIELESIYATAPVGLGFLDTQLRFIRINDRLADMDGVPTAQHLRRTVRQVLPELAETIEPLLQQVLQTGEPLLNCEVRGRTRAQPHLERDWIVSYCPLKDEQNQVLGINIMVQEITELKRAEQQLRESEAQLQIGVQVAGIALAEFDYSSNQVMLSPEAAALYGFSPDQQVVTREQIHATFHPDERDELLAIIDRVLDPTGQGWFSREHRVVWPDGEVRWLNVRKQVFFDRSTNPPRPIYAILAGLDITAAKQLEAERERLLVQERAARAEAERANRVKDEFLAVLSHELRSPLNPILGWARLLQTHQFEAERITEGLATIERNAKLQTQLIDDLLDVAKILRGKLSMNAAPVDLVFVVGAAIDTMRTAAIAKEIRLNVMLAPVGQVYGDEARLQQIVWNLVSNAIKFTPSQGQVEIRLDQQDHQARLTVRDTGKGINPEFLPYIFESFRQEDASTTRKYGGLGLGLAIVSHLVQAHGGTIQAESEGEGRGATFTVQLPLLNNVLTTDSPAAPEAEILDLRGIRILVVDDEPDARQLAVVVLNQYGAEAIAVATAAQVFAQLESALPDVLVTDIGMPETDGYALLQQIRCWEAAQNDSLTPRRPIPAIALTAYAREEDYQRALNSGFQRHLTKPLDPEQLAQAVLALARLS